MTDDLVTVVEILSNSSGETEFRSPGGGIIWAGKLASTVQMTQAEYDALGSPDPDTLYIIVG